MGVCVCVCVCIHAEQIFKKKCFRFVETFFETILGKNYNRHYQIPSRKRVNLCSVQFNIVSMLSEKPIIMRSIPSLRGFPSVAFETVPMFV